MKNTINTSNTNTHTLMHTDTHTQTNTNTHVTHNHTNNNNHNNFYSICKIESERYLQEFILSFSKGLGKFRASFMVPLMAKLYGKFGSG